MNEFYKSFKFNYLISIFLHIVLLFVYVKKDNKKFITPIQITEIQYFKNENDKNKAIENKLGTKIKEPEKIPLREKKNKEVKKLVQKDKKPLPDISEKKLIQDKTLKQNEKYEKKLDIKDSLNDDDDEILSLSSKITPKKNKESKLATKNNKIEFEKNFPFDYYIQLIIKKITDNWQIPFVPGNAKCTVYFKIHKNGTVSDVRIDKNSRYKDFDESAISSIIKIKSFPELPSEYKEEFLGVFFYFEFA